MKLTNSNIWQMISWLNKPMHGVDLRTRNEFFLVVRPGYQQMLDDRVAVLEKHADKDDKGVAIIENGTYKISDSNQKEYQKEVSGFIDIEQEYSIDKKLGKQIAQLLDKQNIPVGIEEGKKYLELLAKLTS